MAKVLLVIIPQEEKFRGKKIKGRKILSLFQTIDLARGDRLGYFAHFEIIAPIFGKPEKLGKFLSANSKDHQMINLKKPPTIPDEGVICRIANKDGIKGNYFLKVRFHELTPDDVKEIRRKAPEIQFVE